MKTLRIALTMGMLSAAMVCGAQRNTVTDGNWLESKVFLQNTPEAEFMYRLGDVDNISFEFPDEFDPFCGKTTDAHQYPWEPKTTDLPGMDRILLSSKFNPGTEFSCFGDGYSVAYDPKSSKPVPYVMDMPAVKGAALKDGFLQIFIDDFQAPSMGCSRFTVTLNGTRYVEAERVLNAVDQTGPVGKLITLPIPEDLLRTVESTGKLSLMIDEANGAPDGWAIDFVKLLLNRRLTTNCIGSIQGFVKDKETGEFIAGATVTRIGGSTMKSDANGSFWIRNVPTGLEVVNATAPGYDEGSGMADIGLGDENNPFEILLERSKGSVQYDGKTLKAGESITLNAILFDQGSANLRPESKVELDKIAAFLKANPEAEIELSGHTSSEGDAAMNRSLSYRRVKACKDYVVAQGVDTGRIQAVGRGPDSPVAPNDTEPNRAKNRRVEMRVLKL